MGSRHTGLAALTLALSIYYPHNVIADDKSKSKCQPGIYELCLQLIEYCDSSLSASNADVCDPAAYETCLDMINYCEEN